MKDVELSWVRIEAGAKMSCRCSSLLSHWERAKAGVARGCGAIGCRHGHLLGVSVRKTEGSDEQFYVVPLCPFHAKQAGELPVNALMMVPLGKQRTCQ